MCRAKVSTSWGHTTTVFYYFIKLVGANSKSKEKLGEKFRSFFLILTAFGFKDWEKTNRFKKTFCSNNTVPYCTVTYVGNIKKLKNLDCEWKYRDLTLETFYIEWEFSFLVQHVLHKVNDLLKLKHFMSNHKRKPDKTIPVTMIINYLPTIQLTKSRNQFAKNLRILRVQKRSKKPVLWIRIHWIPDTDPDPAFQVNQDLIRIQGFDDQKLKKKI